MKTLIIAAVASAFSLGAVAASHAEKGAPMAKPAAAASAPMAKKAASAPMAKAKKAKKAASGV